MNTYVLNERNYTGLHTRPNQGSQFYLGFLKFYNYFFKEKVWNEMATKVIYFKIGDRLEQAEFRSDFPPEDVKGKLA